MDAHLPLSRASYSLSRSSQVRSMSSYFDTLGVLQELGVPSGEVSVDLCSGEGYFTAPYRDWRISSTDRARLAEPRSREPCNKATCAFAQGLVTICCES